MTGRNLVSRVYYTYPFNLTGQPAASVCAGIASDGMPARPAGPRGVAKPHAARAAAAFAGRSRKGYNARLFAP